MQNETKIKPPRKKGSGGARKGAGWGIRAQTPVLRSTNNCIIPPLVCRRFASVLIQSQGIFLTTRKPLDSL